MAVLETTQFEQLVSEVKEQLLAESQGVGEVPVVDSLDNIVSLPALRGQNEVVEAPLTLLSQPAEDAAAEAEAKVAEAVQNVSDSITSMNEEVDAYLLDAETRVQASVDNATDTAEHPTYIGEDNYVYVWDKTTKAYNKTDIYVRGEGFHISRVYASIEAMHADTEHGLKAGDFVLINTDDVENPDNAQLFVLGEDGVFTFLVDMSGAIGFTGKTPQFSIGAINAGTDSSDASASLSDNGTDSDGNPMYKLNLTLPTLTFEDLTADNIAELQSPANDMIAVLEDTDTSVKAAEALRVSAEASRVEAESSRVEAENARAESETKRKENESLRQTNESNRESAEDVRIEGENERISNENTRISNEEARQSAESVRQSNEDERIVSESNREAAEDTRVATEAQRQTDEESRETAEVARANAETIRQSEEETRTANEQTRVSNESARVTAENERKIAEASRVEEESNRVSAETTRTTEFNSLKADMAEATENANNTAAEVKNVPKIQNGTWWVYDFETGTYIDSGSPAVGKSPQIIGGTWWTWNDETNQLEDTGQSTSSDYVLTKAKVEGVLTGDIQSHNHSQYALAEDIPSPVTVDSELSDSSENPVQNKIINAALSGKQGTIEDLDAIRAGASKGSTATQPADLAAVATSGSYSDLSDKPVIPSALSALTDDASHRTVTDEEKAAWDAKSDFSGDYNDLTGKPYIIEEAPSDGSQYVRQDGDWAKVNVPESSISFTDLSASNWISDSTYPAYPYRCDLSCPDVTAEDYATVVYGLAEAVSGNYAPVCETKADAVSIWSAVNNTVTIPTIIITR